MLDGGWRLLHGTTKHDFMLDFLLYRCGRCFNENMLMADEMLALAAESHVIRPSPQSLDDCSVVSIDESSPSLRIQDLSLLTSRSHSIPARRQFES